MNEDADTTDIGGCNMIVKLNRERNRIKGGWSSRSPMFGVTAHGYSPEVADKNLERVVRHILASFERGGVLEQEISALGIGSGGSEGGIQIVLED